MISRAFIAGTRGALGFGAALLLAARIPEPRRRALGWSLVGLGAAATIPAAMKVLRSRDSVTSSSTISEQWQRITRSRPVELEAS
jgi:hypothetical protein